MNDVELLSEHGLFWLPEDDKKKVWGTLRVNEVSEASLETFGALISNWGEGLHKIVGQIRGGTESVTLIDCFPINTGFSGRKWDGEDWSHQTCWVNKVIEGIEFEEGEEIAFEQTIVEISSLTK